MVVGPTGCGKSTLVDVICGLYPSYYKNIKLNSQYHDINIKKFQSTISYVPQFFFCRKGTLGEFLLEANAQFSNRYAAKLLKDFELEFLIEGNQVKLEFLLEENFKNLSGGQRQRLVLVLEILRGPKLLILDEATNALDASTENKILQIIIDLGVPLIISLIIRYKQINLI